MIENIQTEIFMGIYIALAVTYNLLSLLWIQITGRGFASTDPSDGITKMTVLYLTFLMADKMSALAAITIMVSFFILIGRYGIIQHLLNYNKDDYLSRLTWISAIGINVFGLVIISISILQLTN